MTDPTPVELEATGAETVQVDYAGQSYTFPASLDIVDGDVIDAIDDMKLSHALKGLLSVEDWARFKATKPLLKHYGEFFDAFASAIGLGTAGE